jgi:excisionase family DNA binding protein
MTDTLKRYLSVKEICARLPICKSLVYRLVRDGTIPSTRLGGKILVPEEGLVAILRQPVEEPPPDPPARQERLRQPRRKRGQVDLW